MNTINVNRLNLIQTIKANRETHKKDYEVALTKYRYTATEKMKENLALAESGGEIKIYLDVKVPESHADDYDRVIGMLEISVDETIPLTAAEYNTYVRDEWNWSRSFASNTKVYSGH